MRSPFAACGSCGSISIWRNDANTAGSTHSRLTSTIRRRSRSRPFSGADNRESTQARPLAGRGPRGWRSIAAIARCHPHCSAPSRRRRSCGRSRAHHHRRWFLALRSNSASVTRQLVAADAHFGTPRRRARPRSIASSSNTIATSSTNTASGRSCSGANGRRGTRATPKPSGRRHADAAPDRRRSMCARHRKARRRRACDSHRA